MKKKRIEAFENFEVEPSRDLWNRIESNLPVPKKRRWYFLWIVPALVILLAGLRFAGRNAKLTEFDSTVSTKQKQVAPIASQSSIEKNAPGKNSESKTSMIITSGEPNKNGSVAINKNLRANRTTNTNAQMPTNVSVNDETNSSVNDYHSGAGSFYASTELMELSKSDLKVESPEYDLDFTKRKKFEQESSSLSRWTIFAGAGLTLAYSYDQTYTGIENSDYCTYAINSTTFYAGAAYDLSPRIKLSTGFSYFTAGQEQSSSTMIHLHGFPGDPNNTYSFSSNVGNLTGNGQEFNNAYFGSADSLLFYPINTLATTVDSVATREFTLREEFNYVQIPVEILFKPMEHRFTPFVGVYFSAAYLISNTVELNDERLNYQYEEVSKILLSAGFKLGIDYKLSKTVSLFVNGYYQEGLNSVISESNWKPFVLGATGGVSYRFRNKY